MNYVITQTTGGMNIVAYPEGASLPGTSNVNASTAGETVASFGIAAPTKQRISIKADPNTAHVSADSFGYFVL